MVIIPTAMPFKGLKKQDFYERCIGKRPDPDNETQVFIDIASAIIQQAVEDWQYLEYGKIDKAKYLSQPVRYDELLNFFNSDWFEFLLSYALPGYTADDIRTALKIK